MEACFHNKTNGIQKGGMDLSSKKRFFYIGILTIFVLTVLWMPFFSIAETVDVKSKATTISDPWIPVEELKLLLEPLTQKELEKEAEAWVMLLRDKIKQINYTEIAVKRTTREITHAKKIADAVKEVQQAAATLEADETAKPSRMTPEKTEKARQTMKETMATLQTALQEAQTSESQYLENEAITALKNQALEATSHKQGESAAAISTLMDIAAASDPTSQQLEKVEKTAQILSAEKAEIKTQLITRITELRAEKTLLVDRVNAVLDAFKLKGGDDAMHRKYISAISGITVDVSDTDAVWLTLSGWLKSDQGGIRWLKNISFFVIIIVCFWFLSKMVGKAAEKALSMHQKLSSLMRDFLENLIRRIILAIGLIMALSALEFDIGPLLAVIGAAGFVIAFALQETLGNFASGIMILVYRPFDVGDFVDVAGVSGTVVRMNLVSTTIATVDNQVMIVPNNSIWGGVITNVTGSHMRRVDMVFGIGYSDDIGAAQKVLETIVREHPLTLDHPEPVIRLNELADSSVNFICRPWVKTGDYWTVYWDITRTVKEQFDANGISIPFPQQDVHLHQIPAQ
jgi:small conductance mechanosensitive channel